MEYNENMNISNIETFLEGLLRGVVSDNTFVGTLPTTIKTDWNDMCLVTLSNSILDLDAKGTGLAFIWLYAKPNRDGTKNVKKMAELENAIQTAIESNTNSNYSITRRSTYTEYDSLRKWHCNIVELNIQIFNNNQ